MTTITVTTDALVALARRCQSLERRLRAVAAVAEGARCPAVAPQCPYEGARIAAAPDMPPTATAPDGAPGCPAVDPAIEAACRSIWRAWDSYDESVRDLERHRIATAVEVHRRASWEADSAGRAERLRRVS